MPEMSANSELPLLPGAGRDTASPIVSLPNKPLLATAMAVGARVQIVG